MAISFIECLNYVSADTLRALAIRRGKPFHFGANVKTRASVIRGLSNLAGNSYEFPDAYRHTTLAEASLLLHVISHNSALSLASLKADYSAHEIEPLNRSILGLESLGLAFRVPEIALNNGSRDNSVWLVVPEEVIHTLRVTQNRTRSLGKMLNKMLLPAVTRILKNLGVEPERQMLKAEIISEIESRLLDPARLYDILQGLTPGAETALNQLLKLGGSTSVYMVRKLTQPVATRTMRYHDWNTQWYIRNPANGFDELMELGLLVSNHSPFGYEEIFFPREIFLFLTNAPDSRPGAEMPKPFESLSETTTNGESHTSAARDLVTLFSYCETVDCPVTGKDSIHKNALKTIAKQLTRNDVDYALMLYSICRTNGWLEPMGRAGNHRITHQGKLLLNQSSAQVADHLFVAWRYQTDYLEGTPDFYPHRPTDRDLRDTCDAREIIISKLVTAYRESSGGFADLKDIFEHAYMDRWSLFSNNSHKIDEDDFGAVGEAVSGQLLVQRICAGSLFWLGILETTRAKGDEDVYVRLSPSGLRLISSETLDSNSLETIDVREFIVQPNMEIFAPPNMAMDLRFELEQITEPAGSGMLKITSASLRRYFDRNGTPTKVIDFLRQYSRTPIPQNIEYMIKDVGGRHGHIRVGVGGLYIQVDDPILLKEIAANKKTGVRIREMLSDNIAVVQGDNVDQLLKSLRASGYLPISNVTSGTAHEDYLEEDEFRAPRRHEEWPRSLETSIDWAAIEAAEVVSNHV